MNKNFNEIYDSALDGWGFSFRRSQIYRFQKYIDIFKKNNIKGKILEIGCGTGYFTNLMSKTLKNIDTTAIDISQVAIDKAKKRYPNINFDIGRLPNIEFEDEVFECITAIEILYYLDAKDQVESISQIYRAMKENGFFVVSVNIGEKPYFKLDEIRNLVSDKFEIIYEDGLYIKTYYKCIESPIWLILEMFSSCEKIKIKEADSFFKKCVKSMLNFSIKNKLVFYTLGFLIRKICIAILYCMPISIIDKISKFISKNEQSIYICLGQKRT